MKTVWLVIRSDASGNADPSVTAHETQDGAHGWVEEQFEMYYSRMTHYWGENNFGHSVCYIEKGDNTLCYYTVRETEVYP